MRDVTDLISRARELAASYESYGPLAASQLALMLTRVTCKLELLHEENTRLRASTFHPCEQCGRTVMSTEDHP